MRNAFANLPTISELELVARLLLAATLAGVIGVERQWRDREAGIRTHVLVGVGSALFTLVSAYGFASFYVGDSVESVVRADPTRIAAQIVTGIGFLGAGVIMRRGDRVRGLTTAATLWAAAAIGLACGAGDYFAAVAATAITLLALGPMRVISQRLVSLREQTNGGERLHVLLAPGASTAATLAELERLGVQLVGVEIARDEEGAQLACALAASSASPSVMTAALAELDGVLSVEWGR